MRELKRGSQLAGRYTLVRRLGGGRGRETWLARDRLTRASVALKIAKDPAVTAAELRREWQLAMRLVHAHIVRVFEFHDEPDGPFYSLQYIDGVDVSALSGASYDVVLAPLALIARALEYAHARDVVHRDIKASNVLLDGNGAPYLIDFGVAAFVGEAVGGGSLIAASPQQLDGQAPTPADDIFALGGLIYELVSGRSPYSSEDTVSDIRSRVPAALTAPDGQSLPPAITALVAAMLDKEADRRPNASEVVARLTDAGIVPGPAAADVVGRAVSVRDEVIESRAATQRAAPASVVAGADTGVSATGFNPRLVAGGLAVLVLLLLGVVFLLPKAVEQRSEPDAVVAEDEQAPAAEVLADTVSQPLPERDARVKERQAAEDVLGRLLSKTRTLEGRAVERWGGLAWRRAQEAYEAGDAAYLARDYIRAAGHYAEAIEHADPLLDQVDNVFEQTLADAGLALDSGDAAEAVSLFELAVAISPSHAPAVAGLWRAKNLDRVLALTEQGLAHERDLELEAALSSLSQAIEIDPEWQPAARGLERVRAARKQMQFEARMTEGLTALADSDFATARAAFRMALELEPGAPEPADGLLQVDQGIRLERIRALESEAARFEQAERWPEAVATYESILELDQDLTFANEGLARSERMASLHETLDGYIEDPDSLASPARMRSATGLVVDITRMSDAGPELLQKKDRVAELLKRAATPLTVQLVSDNMTDVAIFKVGKLGTFTTTEVTLRPGTYVAVGSRPGYRDVRLEFRVAPEIDMRPVVVRCEEKI